MDLDAIGVKGHRPEQATGSDKRGVVVDLLGCVSQSNWIGEDIQSYEPKNTLVQLTVFCDEHTLHETHVRLKRQCLGES